MPTTRKRKTRKTIKVTLSEHLRVYLETGRDITKDGSIPGLAKAELFMLRKGGDRLHKAWALHRDAILPGWIKKNPCTRPWPWWECDAPKEPVVGGWNYRHFDAAQRKRLGGVGTPTFEVLSCGLRFEFGIPTSYVDQWEVDYYNGVAKDIHGKRIRSGFKKGAFKAVAYNKEDPPTFESEAAYLQRHNLLSEIEEKYLKQHPELLKPEKVEFEEDDED